ncbi:MAG: shikimate dehydrogenase [Betaproteobacteria bacterium]|nr:shikimate dehydrogenase [Betaproteobacteria bacterium]
MNDRYAVIGNPVAHSKSPWIHAEFARATGQRIDYGRIEAPLGAFARTVAAFRAAGGRGCNVTLPFKAEAFALATEPTPRARAARAANTLRFDGEGAGAAVAADNTDGAGLVNDLERNLRRPIAGRRVLLMGAGGAAQGVLGPLLEARPAALVLANRTAGKAQALAARFPGSRGGGYDAIAGESFDIVVNATSAGLTGGAVPLPGGLFAPGALAYDMVYGRDTPFLAAACAAGAATSDGLGMLVEQAAESFFFWCGARPETGAVLAALRADG